MEYKLVITYEFEIASSIDLLNAYGIKYIIEDDVLMTTHEGARVLEDNGIDFAILNNFD